MHGGTGNWHHQIGAGIPAILATRTGKSERRIQFGRDGVELEANVCVGRAI